ncbi:MAG TPA: phospholipase D-like domain-containing protein [Candidatus Saccharimonadales bacterium]
MFDRFKRASHTPDLLGSRLFDETTFYRAFLNDLHRCYTEAVIESPFITSNRVASLLPIFGKMRSRGVSITVITRDPAAHDAPFDMQAQKAVDDLLDIGVQVIYMGGHHRKIAIIDRKTLWEGSLNILSHNDSCEIMRRIDSEVMAAQMIGFTKLGKFLG